MRSWPVFVLFLMMSTLSTAAAGEPLQYRLETGHVKCAQVLKSPNEIRIQVELTRQESEHFAELTRGHIGQLLQIVHADRILLQAIIRAEISSGMILTSGFDSEETANRFIQTLSVGHCR